MSSYFLEQKNITIKLLNGELFNIDINYFDDLNTLKDKICSYNQEYRMRRHRIKLFLKNEENKDENKDENKESDNNYYKEIKNIEELQDEDIVYVFSNEPPEQVKIKDCEFYKIKDKESLYDTIDLLYYRMYNKDSFMIFEISNNISDNSDNTENYPSGFGDDKIRNNKDSLFTLFEHIFDLENQDIKNIFLKCDNPVISSDFSNIFLKFLETTILKLQSLNLNTLGININMINISNIDCYNIDKILYNIGKMKIENLHISVELLNSCKEEITLNNVDNIYIFSQSLRNFYTKNIDSYLSLFKTKHHSIIDVTYNYMNYNRNLSSGFVFDNGWIYIGSNNKDTRYNYYNHNYNHNYQNNNSNNEHIYKHIDFF